MSDFHIREAANNLKSAKAVFHIPIPTGNNAVGKAWRTVLVEHLGGADAITSGLPDIPAADLTSMKAGELYEYVVTIGFTTIHLTNAQRLAEIQAKYSSSVTAVIDRIQTTLNYYGYAGDVV